ncbi:MAG: MFS transporter [Burkholderiaceae bacterium]|nr:MFS transporter [Burkholderiaceae bacterium]MCD8537410.1 MFS transporter [Burkholderiaceae bacterium]MCD8565569.1 MFS transporter [Burkholderiaceae bacterium]
MQRPYQSRWYYGWNIVAGATVLTLLTVGMRLGIGPFFLPMTQDLAFSRSLLSTIIAVGMLCYGLAMPLAGYLVGRWGTRAVLLIGVFVVVLSSFWTIYATTPWALMMSFGILLSVGLAFTSPIALTPVIAKWFTRKRGMALFFLSTGSMAGIAIMTPVFTLAIETVGWQATLFWFAIAFLVIATPIAIWVVRDNPPAHTDTLDNQVAAAKTRSELHAMHMSVERLTFYQAIKSWPFWLICLGLFACGFSMNLLGTHGMPMLMDHGFDPLTSSMGIGLIGVVAIFSTLVLGRLSDVLPRPSMLAVIYLVRGLGFFMLLIVGTKWELFLTSSIGGIVWAGSIALSSAILADIYGVKLVGVLYGWAYLSHQIGATVSSWLGGWGYDTFGTHWIAFGASGVLLVAAAAVSYQLPRQGTFLIRVSA